MKNGWKKLCRCRKGQMLKGIVLTLTLAFLTMGLCGCAEKHDAAEELEEFTLERIPDSSRWNDRRCCRRLDQSGRSVE